MACRQELNCNSQPISINKNLHTPACNLITHIACLVSRNPLTATQLSSNPHLTQDLDPVTREEPKDSHQAAGGSKRPKVEGGNSAAELQAEIAAKRAQLADLLRDQSQAGNQPAPGKYNLLKIQKRLNNSHLLAESGFKSLDVRQRRTTLAMVTKKRAEVSSDRAKVTSFTTERDTILARLHELDDLITKYR